MHIFIRQRPGVAGETQKLLYLSPSHTLSACYYAELWLVQLCSHLINAINAPANHPAPTLYGEFNFLLAHALLFNLLAVFILSLSTKINYQRIKIDPAWSLLNAKKLRLQFFFHNLKYFCFCIKSNFILVFLLNLCLIYLTQFYCKA